MSTTINTGWLKDNNGDKFAPKTLTSQVQTSDGVLLENKIETDILSAKDDMQKYTDTVVSDKADASHIHDNMYYTEAEMDSKLSAKSDKTHNHDTVYDTKGSAEDALTESKEYTDSVASGKADLSHTHKYAGSSSAGGSANSAVKWSTARNINGMSVDGSANRTNYGTCSTAASTAAKTVACDGFSLITGAEITVKFTVSNTADSPTLNVNGTGAKPIFYRGAAITKTYIVANRTYTFRYDGTNWDLVGDINTDTDTKVTQTNTTTSADYRLLMSSTADDTSRAEAARKNANLKYNPSTGVLSAPVFSGSVDASNINGVVPISKGGTDATTVVGAQENLGILTPDEIVNLYVWKKYDSNPETYVETERTEISITSKVDGVSSYYSVKYADSVTINNGVLELVDLKTLSSPTTSNITDVKGKYCRSTVTENSPIFYVDSDATFTTKKSGLINYIVASSGKLVTVPKMLQFVASKDEDTYPSNGEHTDGYWYVYHKQLGE